MPLERWQGREEYHPSENVAPGAATPVVLRDDAGQGRALRSMRWGLVPSYTGKGEKPDFFRMVGRDGQVGGSVASRW